ncbi:type IV secretion system protein [Salmonella enterica]|nr:type IV secretion system protein [Salmonella enterica]
MGIASDFLNQTKDLVMSAVANNFTIVANSIKPLMIASFLLYCVFIAWMILYNNREVIVGEVLKNLIVFSLIGAFVWNAGYYQQWIVPFVMDSGQEIAAKISGTGNVATNVDDTFQRLSESMENFKQSSVESLGWDPGPIILVYIIYLIGYIGGSLLLLYTTIYLCVSTFMTGILLSVGAIFICFSGFAVTRSMFTSWCGHCLNYILLNVFYAIAFTFVLTLIQKYTAVDPLTLSFWDVVQLLLAVVICLSMVEMISVLCSSLTGGVGINGLVPGVGSLAKMTGIPKALGSLGKKLGGAMKNGGAALMNAFKNNIKGG